MKKKLFVLNVVMLVITFALSLYYFIDYEEEKKKIIIKDNLIYDVNDENNNNTLEDEKEIVVEEKETITNKSEPKEDIAPETKKEENKKESSDATSNLKEENNQFKNETIKSENSKEETTKVDTPKEEPKKELTEWEKLGISEYDYYNKPMWNWMKLSFKLEDYGSQEATEKACREYGNKKAEEESLGFSCTNVLSYSGKYLGEYIKFF